LLLVFLMAAIVAISLYMQIPRVAFQSQRQKEQLLMSRGEQYKRAIQLFVRANGRYPTEIKDLENFNNRRYLRHKFVDPITGKDEWRLIHVNAAGVFTDSVRNKKKDSDKKDEQATGPQFVAEEPGLGSNPNQGQAVTNPALVRRASEGGPPGPVGIGGRIGLDGQPVQYMPPAQGDPTQQAAGTPPPPLPGAPIPGQPYTPVQGIPNPVTGSFGATPPNPGAVVNNGVQVNNNASPGAPVPPEIGNFPNAQRQAVPAQQQQTSIAPPGIMPGVVQPGQQGIPQQNNLNQGNFNQRNQANPANQSNNTSSFVGGGGSFVGGSSFVGSGGSFVGGQTNTTSGGANNPIPQPNQPTQFQPPQQQFQPPQQQFQPPQAQFQSPQQQFQPQANTPFPVSPQQPVTQAGNTTPITGGSNQASDMIGRLLTSPRTQPQPNTQQGGQQIGGGIAGVASTSESPSIMVYNDRTNYNEWEFIFDLTKQRAAANPNGGVVGTPAQNIGTGIGPTPGAQPGVNANATANPRMGVPGIGGFGAQTAQPTATGTGTPGSTPAGQNPAAFGQQQGGIPPDIRLGRP
jgi:type II secretory pathway pseudopilin PulG